MIRKLLILCALAEFNGAALAASAAPPPSKLSCEYEIKQSCTLGGAKVEIKDGRIQRIVFHNHFCSTQDELGFTCWIEVSRDDKNSEWTDRGGSSTIKFSDTNNSPDGDSMRVRPVKDGVVIDMRNTSSPGHCGFGAELPARIFVPATSKKCEVKLSDY